jgi:exonuclease VII large subunit
MNGVPPGYRPLTNVFSAAMTERGARLDGERRLLQVGDVLRAIEDQFRTAFPRRVWVCGFVRGMRSAALGHTHAGVPLDSFVLVDATDEGLRTLPCELLQDTRETVDDSLRRIHDVAVEDLLVDGHYVRVGGLLSYDADRHCAIFTITALDPLTTAAWLSTRREDVRVAAAAARLSERQRDLRVPMAPATVGLVAPAGDPALERSREMFATCGFEVDVLTYAPDTAGADAGDQLANGLREAALAGHDLILLLRQDGRPLSLAPYDSEAVVRAVASSPTPILTGLGSPEEPAAAEEVCHQAYPTAEDATRSVIRRLQRASDLVEDTVDAIAVAGDEALRRAARRLEQMRHAVTEESRRATIRAQKLRARRLLRIRIAAGILALIIIAGAAATQIWPVLAALVVPLAIALAAPRLRTQRRGPVSVAQYTFSESLAQLSTIGRQLQEASDPDDVLRLEAEAEALAVHCRGLLRRPRPLSREPEAMPQAPAATWPAVAADGGVLGSPPAPPATSEPGETEIQPTAIEDDAPATITMDVDQAIDIDAVTDTDTDTGAPTTQHTVVLPADSERSAQS